MNKAIAIQRIYPGIKPVENFIVMEQTKITYWNYPQPQPTETQLQQAWNDHLNNPIQEELTPVEEVNKRITDLSFDLMIKGVL